MEEAAEQLERSDRIEQFNPSNNAIDTDRIVTGGGVLTLERLLHDLTLGSWSRTKGAPQPTGASGLGAKMCQVRAMVHRVAVLALDEVVAFDLSVAWPILGEAQRGGQMLYDVRVCGLSRRCG